MTKRAVFLDRDGVLNRYTYNAELGTVDTPATPEQFELLPGAGEGVAALNELKIPVIVVSNQPGIAKGKITRELLDAITEKLHHELQKFGARVDDVFYCTHHPESVVPKLRILCECRKPKPGLLLQAAEKWKLNLANSFFIGDGVDDVLAGRAAGVRTILLASRRCIVCEEFASKGARPQDVAESLTQAAELINAMGHTPATSDLAPPSYSCVLINQSGTYTSQYLREAVEIAVKIDPAQIERAAFLLRAVRDRGGRLFLLGVGGGAGHASHAACDFRKIAQIEAYSVSDNVSELTARVNDDGWDSSYVNWLRGSRLRRADMLFVFSVGGGNVQRNISANLVRALQFGREVGCAIGGVVGRDGGFTAQVADACVLVPTVNAETVTPHTESFQALVWHLLVSHPVLKAAEMKWESVTNTDTPRPSEGAR